jgi:hypothetical protein
MANDLSSPSRRRTHSISMSFFRFLVLFLLSLSLYLPQAVAQSAQEPTFHITPVRPVAELEKKRWRRNLHARAATSASPNWWSW